MPDADDFDVEYFRSLLKGDSAKEGAKVPEPAKKTARPKASAAKLRSAAKPKKRAGR